jgi:hypothetical protein
MTDCFRGIEFLSADSKYLDKFSRLEGIIVVLPVNVGPG